MPVFDFQCSSCGAVRDELVSSTEEVVQCECGSPMQRLASFPTALLTSVSGRMALHQDSSLHQEWLERNGTDIDRKLKSGEYSVMSPSDDMAHRLK